MHIPFKGAGEATMAMLSGTIDFQIASTPGVMGNVKGGKARMLAVSGDKRLGGAARRARPSPRPASRTSAS